MSTSKATTNPLVVLFSILLLAGLLTYLVDSGSYQRDGKLVVPGSYSTIEKDRSVTNLWRVESPVEGAAPVSLTELFLAIPEGLERGAGLIFMVLVIGGMFGILKQAGAVDAGLERLLSSVRGNVYVLVPSLMLVFAAGSTFLGLASEYLLIIPLMVAMAERLGLTKIIGLGIVTVAVKAGYLSSVTNPLPLTIAQPLVGVPIFSGAGLRFVFFLIFTIVGIGFMLWVIRRHAKLHGMHDHTTVSFESKRLSLRHTLMWLVLLSGIGFLVYASNTWQWNKEQLTAFYLALSVVLAFMSGMGVSRAADAFVAGMKKILLASFLIGVAFAIAVTLEQGRILDTVIYGLTSLVGEGNAYVAAQAMLISQLGLDFLIPSTSGQAAVSMPILGPLGQLAGVGPQTTVLAFLFGNGITNMITPTSGTLLAYLATAQVPWSQWAKFILPLCLIFIALAMLMLSYAVMLGA
ncbi:YfcC family protein [Pseudidiomarina sediminum]|uniref:YfcC family protein n=1 Tax=Pseudidiomarina sediminum TaxID=431675 RepID=A0A432Z975_9GAMM|nr:YfcC family protein [Pseudidiomarina sediminum]MBY6063650.1 YfcC family protein [Pseudidiomarina sediminum]RUO74469.1 YfcC family protein [Pseudidiomarina sediminum]